MAACNENVCSSIVFPPASPSLKSLKTDSEVMNDFVNNNGMANQMEASPASSASSEHTWEKSLNRCVPAIIVIRVMSVKPFDGAGASSSYATGFVVDKKRGIVLTNRHVITSGPVVADAILKNKEEIALEPIWRDPVHDYAFARYNVDDIKYMGMTEIELDPEAAKVGREIRVVGNDAGEKLQILSGILARVDRDAPFYGSSAYNDFNTFYISAASSTSGGSSGSPVLTIEGKAAALNCGAAKQAASSFYLPLHRIKRSLDLLVKGEAVPRGTLQTIFKHKAYDEVRRLGLTTEMEGLIRKKFPEETGMLVVDQVIPKGPACDLLEPGDVLVEVENRLITTFTPLEEILDNKVEENLTLKIQRGGEEKLMTFKVQDLHSIIPTEFLTMSSAIIHPLSYHHAKNYHLPTGGVYVASTGYMLTRAGIDIHCIITSVGGKETPDLPTFQTVMESFPDGARTSLQYFGLTDRNRIRTAVITIDRKWFIMGKYVRSDPKWIFTPSPPPPPVVDVSATVAPVAKRLRSSSEDEVMVVEEESSSIPDEVNADAVTPMNLVEAVDGKMDAEGHEQQPSPQVSKIIDSLVMVSFDVPHLISGVSSGEYQGAGVIVDKDYGLVLTDRLTVPFGLGDAVVTIGGVVELPGECVFVHPIHNFSIVRYCPSKLAALTGDMNPPIEEVQFSTSPLKIGDVTTFHGLTNSFVPVCQKSTVTRREMLKLSDGRPPQFVAANTDSIFFDQVPATNGIFVDSDGKVAALRLCFAYQSDEVKQVYRSIPAEIFVHTVSMLRDGAAVPRTVPCLPIRFTNVQLAKAKAGMGLSDERYKVLSNKIRREGNEAVLLMVRRVAVGTKVDEVVQTGDLVLAVEGIPVCKPFEVGELIRGKKQFTLDVLRNHEEVVLEVEATEMCSFGTDRLVLWSGLMLQDPHLAVRFLGYVPEEGGGVYVSRWSYGSPAQKHGLRATMFICEVNNQPTPDLDTFLAVVKKLDDQSAIRLKARDLDRKVRSYNLKGCNEYWPTTEIVYRRESKEWIMINHSSSAEKKME